MAARARAREAEVTCPLSQEQLLYPVVVIVAPRSTLSASGRCYLLITCLSVMVSYVSSLTHCYEITVTSTAADVQCNTHTVRNYGCCKCFSNDRPQQKHHLASPIVFFCSAHSVCLSQLRRNAEAVKIHDTAAALVRAHTSDRSRFR